MWLWDLAEVINTGVLHEGAIPLCVYTVRHRAKISYCTAALVLSFNAGRHCRGWPGISHKNRHTHTLTQTLTAQIRFPDLTVVIQLLETVAPTDVFSLKKRFIISIEKLCGWFSHFLHLTGQFTQKMTNKIP